jgi:hypothetical protein
MRTPGWLGVILALLIALIAGGIGFAIGTTTTLPADAAGVSTMPVAWGWHGWGFPFFPLFGFLVFALLIALLVGLARRAAWGGRGWHGSHAWGPPGPGDPRRLMFDDWHRRAHAQGDPAAQQGQAPPQSQPPQWPPMGGQPPDAPPMGGQPPYGPPPGGPNAQR